jgi:hypothetical protein
MMLIALQSLISLIQAFLYRCRRRRRGDGTNILGGRVGLLGALHRFFSLRNEIFTNPDDGSIDGGGACIISNE